MTDEKKQPAEQPEAANQTKKKKLLPAMCVALGAIVGGAGVTFMAPKNAPEQHAPAAKVIRLFDHPDAMEFTVNPVVQRGHKTASIVFKFTYKADESLVFVEGQSHAEAESGGQGGAHGGGAPAAPPLGPVPKAIKQNWDRAYSRCLEALTNQSTETLMDPDGKRQVKRLLKDELTATLFPDGNASVDDILWTRFVVN